MTTAMTTVDAKEKFAELINHIIHTKERIVLTRRGKEVAAIIPLEDLQLLETKRDKEDLNEAIDAFKEAKVSGTITLEKLKEAVGT
jgi:prevent-host-death family protein